MAGIVNNTWYYFTAGIGSNIGLASPLTAGELPTISFGIAAVKFTVQEFLSQGNKVTDFFVETGSASDEIFSTGGAMSYDWNRVRHETLILCCGWRQGDARGIRVRINWVGDAPVPDATCIITLAQVGAVRFVAPVSTSGEYFLQEYSPCYLLSTNRTLIDLPPTPDYWSLGINKIEFLVQEFLSQGNKVTDFFIETGSNSNLILASGGAVLEEAIILNPSSSTPVEWASAKHESCILCCGWEQDGAKGIRTRINWVSDSPPHKRCIITLAQLGVRNRFQRPVKTKMSPISDFLPGIEGSAWYKTQGTRSQAGGTPPVTTAQLGLATFRFDPHGLLSGDGKTTDFFIETGSISHVILASGGRLNSEWGTVKHESTILCTGWEQNGSKGIRVRINWVSDQPPNKRCMITVAQAEADYYKMPVKTS
jgi:hypothetical protein